MSEIKHTPGPWWASGLEVGTVPMMDIKVARVSGATLDEARANARLIAAAPAMLEALEKISSETAATWVQDVANEAIAKATGGQS
jgi:hypothetical protein